MAISSSGESNVKKVLGIRIALLEQILQAREKELMDVKGPCADKECRLWRAHYGPCFTGADK